MLVLLLVLVLISCKGKLGHGRSIGGCRRSRGGRATVRLRLFQVVAMVTGWRGGRRRVVGGVVDTATVALIAGLAWLLAIALDFLATALRAGLLDANPLTLLPWVLGVQVHEGDLGKCRRGRGCGHGQAAGMERSGLLSAREQGSKGGWGGERLKFNGAEGAWTGNEDQG